MSKIYKLKSRPILVCQLVEGNAKSKPCGLRFGWISQFRTCPLPDKRRLPLQHRTNLSWFCESNFINKSLIPRETLKAGYTAHNFRHMQVPNPVCKYTYSFCLITSWVSTIIGSWHICRYMLPKNLNFQHQPRFGQSKPAPETSSLCQ